MFEIFGNRKISISREITKKFETVYRGNIEEILSVIPEKGEFVIVVEGNNNSNIENDIDVVSEVDMYIKSGYDTMTSIKMVAKDRNVSKNVIYKEYHSKEKKKWS